MKTESTNRDASEARYWAADEKWGAALDALRTAGTATERARLLYKAHQAIQQMGWLHTNTFGPDPIPGEGRDLAESHMNSAMLYGLLADVEQAIAFPALGRRNTTTTLERHAADILNRMASTPDTPDGLAERMRMLDALIDAVVDLCGGQAVESLWCLPAPGMVGPHTIAERDAWLAEHGQGEGVATFSERMERVWPWLTLIATVVFTVVSALAAWRGLATGHLPFAIGGLAVAVIIPTLYIRARIRRNRFLAEPTMYDDENPSDPDESDDDE